MENFFGLLKQAIEAYIQYYNNERIKQKLAGMSPVQYRLHTSQLAV
ncbi:IS3 family transposase [Cytobacillus praedii]